VTLLTIALDWTPNINHIGILIAKEKGFFKEYGIDINISNPEDDNYFLTPGKKLELGIAELALAPFETVISLNNKPKKFDAIAVYAILQQDISAIVTLKSSGISRPSEMAGKIYASYAARYEDAIVKIMTVADGIKTPFKVTYPNKLGIWNTLLSGHSDATWIFDNWEGVEAKTQGIELNSFKLADYGIPYCYSPVIIGKKSLLDTNKELYLHALLAIKHGYEYIYINPEEALSILKKYVSRIDKNRINLSIALSTSLPYFGGKHCGYIEKNRVQMFLKWLVDNGLEAENILEQHLFENQLSIE
jgi:ABC-type nitrate/sulfonate/bicarbonate transport system substrate-binding protein